MKYCLKLPCGITLKLKFKCYDTYVENWYRNIFFNAHLHRCFSSPMVRSTMDRAELCHWLKARCLSVVGLWNGVRR